MKHYIEVSLMKQVNYKSLYPYFTVKADTIKNVYHKVDVECEFHGTFKADLYELNKGITECPECSGTTKSKIDMKDIVTRWNTLYDKVTQLKTMDLANVRTLLAEYQGNICPLCNKELVRPVVDHWHKARNHGNGHIRMVICATCNSLLGKIENAILRYKLSYSDTPTWLNNVANYMLNDTTNMIHPTEKEVIKISKTVFNKLMMMCNEHNKKVKLVYPKNGIIKSDKLLAIYNEFKHKL